MKRTLYLLIITAAMLAAVALASGSQIPGCTSDVRTGVCNAVCSVSHVQGCTAKQLQPLLSIQHMNCLAKDFPKDDTAKCDAQLDKAIRGWKAAQKSKGRK